MKAISFIPFIFVSSVSVQVKKVKRLVLVYCMQVIGNMREFIGNHPYLCISIAAGVGIGLGTWLGFKIGYSEVVDFVTVCQNCVTNDQLLQAAKVCIKGIEDRNAFRPDTVITILLTDHAEAVQAVQSVIQ